MSSFFDRENTVAAPGFNRFMVPPAALAVHLCIGQAYAISTFNLIKNKLPDQPNWRACFRELDSDEYTSLAPTTLGALNVR